MRVTRCALIAVIENIVMELTTAFGEEQAVYDVDVPGS
jgi:hypothetical protein